MIPVTGEAVPITAMPFVTVDLKMILELNSGPLPVTPRFPARILNWPLLHPTVQLLQPPDQVLADLRVLIFDMLHLLLVQHHAPFVCLEQII